MIIPNHGLIDEQNTHTQYHQFIRIQRAKHLIQFTDDSIDAIAEKMGYPNIHAFSRAFKTVDGIPPSFYRN